MVLCRVLQQDINDKMRAILVDWLVEVHLKFKVRTKSAQMRSARWNVAGEESFAVGTCMCIPGLTLSSIYTGHFSCGAHTCWGAGAAQLMPETLFLTTNLIDRFLEIKGVTRKNLQLV